MDCSREHTFQRTATAALLGNNDIRKSFQDCLICIREYLPGDYLSLHLFDEGLGTFETVVDATPDRSPAASTTTVLTPEAREMIREVVNRSQNLPPYLLIDCLKDSIIGTQLGMDLNTPDSAALVMRLTFEGRYLGSAALTPNDTSVRYTDEDGRLFHLLHDAMALVTALFLNRRECSRLKEILEDKTNFLQSELLRSVNAEVVGADFGLKNVIDNCRRVAPTDTPVLLLGETGSGKEVIAGALHRLSARHDGPFIKVNCGGIPPSLLESTLFGHVKGAFTGASANKKGYFERAEGGTIFLDEIGELPLEAQSRFLHVLQDKTFERVGGGQIRTADVRVIAATNRRLETMVEQGTFRQDLFFRLNVFPVTIPPLRERKGDVPPLTAHFIRRISRDMGLTDLPKTAPGAVDRLMEYDWPGNVRELANVVEREIIVSRDNPLTFESILPTGGFQENPDDDMSLDTAAAKHIMRALRLTKGKVEGEGGAAELLGVNPRTLQSRMKKLGVPFGRKAGNLYSH